jgi:hypothetical protein
VQVCRERIYETCRYTMEIMEGDAHGLLPSISEDLLLIIFKFPLMLALLQRNGCNALIVLCSLIYLSVK